MNLDKNSPYYSYLISVFSEKLLDLSKTWAKKIHYTDTVAENIMYYQNSNLGDHPDDSLDVIAIDTAIDLLIKEGADLFYIDDNTETLLTVLIKNRNFENKIKDKVIDLVDTEKLCSLPTKWNNNIFYHLLISGEVYYLEKLMEKGLVYEQNQYYDENSYEVRALTNGNLKLFETLLALNKDSINFDHVYTYKKDYHEVPEENAQQITLRSVINKIINHENILEIGTDSYNTAVFLSKFLLHQDLQNKLPAKAENNRKIKI